MDIQLIQQNTNNNSRPIRVKDFLHPKSFPSLEDTAFPPLLILPDTCKHTLVNFRPYVYASEKHTVYTLQHTSTETLAQAHLRDTYVQTHTHTHTHTRHGGVAGNLTVTVQ